MPILNQPFSEKLGDLLKQKLITVKKGNFIIFSAFAKNSGVLRLKDAITTFKNNGGHVTAFIGVDLDGTSYEALWNLFKLCDNLYIVHSEDPRTTYHSKIYLIDSPDEKWFTVGSNNMTGGGLWTNFESCYVHTLEKNESSSEWKSILDLVNTYSSESYCCSKRIDTISEIDTLLTENYIAKEFRQHIERSRIQKEKENGKTFKKIFGKEKVLIPEISGDRPKKDKNSTKKENTIPAFENECFWFEMRKSTGGSRNILDLSKRGTIQNGSVKGTPYYISDENKMYGGVKFFELDPDNTSIEKDIVINYRGTDFSYSTIKFAPDNGSWRIQLKGNPPKESDEQELSRYGSLGYFVNTILLFEKITPTYYSLSLINEDKLDEIKKASKVWALNGNGKNSKAFGMI